MTKSVTVISDAVFTPNHLITASRYVKHSNSAYLFIYLLIIKSHSRYKKRIKTEHRKSIITQAATPYYYFTDTDKQNSSGNTQTTYNSTNQQHLGQVTPRKRQNSLAKGGTP